MAASYREAIAWIALNDGNGDAEWLDIEHVSEMVSVALISSIFKKTQEEVSKAVIRYRKMYEKREEPESWIPRVSRNDRRCPNCNSPDVRIGTCGSWYCPSCGNGRRL